MRAGGGQSVIAFDQQFSFFFFYHDIRRKWWKCSVLDIEDHEFYKMLLYKDVGSFCYKATA